MTPRNSSPVHPWRAIFARRIQRLQRMEIQFAKWHGTGNDFIMIDDRDGTFPVDDRAFVQHLCDRHRGIGSDGIVLIQPPKSPDTEFHMEFFNPDGSQSFCGNGSRCAYAYWCELFGSRSEARFTAIDGEHSGIWKDGMVSITLSFQGGIKRGTDGASVDFINTGSPHELVWVDDPDSVSIMEEGPRRRNAERHGPGGTNVNFVRVESAVLHMRTYERGVEAETLSCGTGVVAAAISALDRKVLSTPVHVRTRGGSLQVEALRSGVGEFGEVRLTGPVKAVFTGRING